MLDPSQEPSRPQYDDEINLVDLARTFLRRRRVFYIVFVVVSLGGVAYALFAPEKHEYVTLVKLAEKANGEFIEEPGTVIAELDSLWVPDLQAEHHQTSGSNLPFSLSASNPENTGLVRIVSEAPPATAELVEKNHRQLIERLNSEQGQAFAVLQKSLEKQIESLESTVKMLEAGENTGDAIASAVEKQLSLESSLESLSPFEALVVSRRSGENADPSRRLIVALSIMLGLLAGVFIAFFAEFISLVKGKTPEI